MHSAAFTRDGAKLFIGNDGGVWSTTDAAANPLNWSNLNATLATVLFYPNGLSVHPTDPNIALGGTQDNGELKYGGTAAWAQVGCGDGGTSAFDFTAPNIVYTTCVNDGHLYKSTSGGSGWAAKIDGIETADIAYTPQALAIDPSNSRRLYFGVGRIYQSIDGADHWRAISPRSGGQIRIITVAAGDPNTVWAGGGAGVQTTRNALSPNPAWASRTAGLPARPVTQIAVAAKDPLTAYVTLSHYAVAGGAPGHVFKTIDGGATWKDLSANLPNVPANDIVLDPDVAGALYIGSDVGVFASVDDGASWSLMGTGLPHVPVNSLKLLRPSRILRAATWGRSAWDLSVPARPPARQP
jgi:photosystem II stability/assembly factor-like uncharacterized protein